MNLLFIHEVDWIRKVVYDVHILAEAMSLRGHQVYAVDYESMWQRDVKYASRLEIHRVFPQARVELIRPSFIKIPMISRLSAFCSHHQAIGKIIKEKEIDAIILYSVPTNGLQAVYWAKKYGIPIVFRSLDVLHRLVGGAVLMPFVHGLERAVYSRVDMSLSLTPALADYMIRLGAKRDMAKVLPMTVDTDTFSPINNGILKPLRDKWGLSGNKVVLFMGTLFEFSGLENIIMGFKRIIKQIPEAKLLIVGDGKQRPLLEALIKNQSLSGHVIITGFQPYWEMSQYINLADVCLNSFIPNRITNDIFPGKLAQFLSCGKPVVSSMLKGVMQMVKDESQGIIYSDDVDRIIDDLIYLLDRQSMSLKIGMNGRAYVEQTHDSKIIAELLEEELLELK